MSPDPVGRLLLALALALLGGCHAKSPGNDGCQSPCDLAQSVIVEIAGGQPAATISVTGPCLGGACGPGTCTTANVTLRDPGPATTGDGAPDLVCHVTATSVDGETAQADLTASYLSDPCCSGYTFSNRTITLTFPPPDAAADGARD
jgi:hypothetical protein